MSDLLCTFRVPTEFGTFKCGEPATVTPEGAHRCVKHDRAVLRVAAPPVPVVGLSVHVQTPDERLHLNWRVEVIAGAEVRLRKPGGPRANVWRVPAAWLRPTAQGVRDPREARVRAARRVHGEAVRTAQKTYMAALAADTDPHGT